MSYQLLIAVEVFDFSQSLPRREQQLLWKRFREIGVTPQRFVDYVEPDRTQRLLDVHLHAGFAIYYWEDAADRHVKILHVCRADA
jgi:hypothetical protein